MRVRNTNKCTKKVENAPENQSNVSLNLKLAHSPLKHSNFSCMFNALTKSPQHADEAEQRSRIMIHWVHEKLKDAPHPDCSSHTESTGTTGSQQQTSTSAMNSSRQQS